MRWRGSSRVLPVEVMLEVVREEPKLGRLDAVARLLVSRVVAAPDGETDLVGLIKCISAAHVATRGYGAGEPERKVARLV